MQPISIQFAASTVNGRKVTYRGKVSVLRRGQEVDLTVIGPQGGMRHMLVLPQREAMRLGEVLVQLTAAETPESAWTLVFQDWESGRLVMTVGAPTSLLVMDRICYELSWRDVDNRIAYYDRWWLSGS